MPMHTSDTRLSHLDCLAKLGWLAFDVTHMGEPDGYLLSPCCEHGYRAVYSPRPKIEWRRALSGDTSTSSSPGSGGDMENAWNWRDAYGGDQANFFTLEQANNREGSWVLIAGARQDGDGPPIDAQAKWWMTTQNDADSLEEEIVSADLYGTSPTGDFTQYSGRGDYLGRSVRWRHNDHWHETAGAFPGLRRWVKNEDPVAGSGSMIHENGTLLNSGLGIEDPGLGESSGLPSLGKQFAADTIWWIKYGNRNFLGINKCNDPIGANQERDDHDTHGTGSNWRGTGLTDIYVNDLVSPGASARGGYIPNIIFYGGDIRGAVGEAICDSSTGDITGINILDPGATVITDAQQDSIDPPLVSVSMPGHYKGFDAKAKISTDPDEIKSALPGLFKTKQEMEAACSGGYNDPIAQTFLVNARSYPDGVLVPSIDICFASKPRFGLQDPVYLEIRPTINGYPSADKIIISKMLYPADVNVSPGVDYDELPLPAWESPILHDLGGSRDRRSDYPAFDNTYGYTRFTFAYPIHLEAGQEYAIVVRSNNTDYKCWISDTRGTEVVKGQSLSKYDNEGYSDVTAVHKKQYGGSFFRSQNGRTWSPDQWQDLMFRINKCYFGGTELTPETGSGVWRAGVGVTSDFLYDKMNLNFHSLQTPGNKTSISAVLSTQKESDAEGTLTEVSGLSGKVIENSWNQGKTRALSQRMKLYKNKRHSNASIKLDLTLETKNPDMSPMIDTRNMSVLLHKNIINSGELSISDIVISTPGLNYSDGDTFTVSGGGSTENATFKIATNGSDANGRILKLEMVTVGKGFHTSTDPNDPVVITPGAGVTGTGATFYVLGEEGQNGGNSQARYVTKTINLAPGMSARAIKVFMTAKQPYQSDIYVYYKALAEEDDEPISVKRWKLMKRKKPGKDSFFETSSSFSSDGGFVEFEFETDELVEYTRTDGRTYDSFKSFAVKIVMNAQNQAKTPEIKDFRAIAVF